MITTATQYLSQPSSLLQTPASLSARAYQVFPGLCNLLFASLPSLVSGLRCLSQLLLLAPWQEYGGRSSFLSEDGSFCFIPKQSCLHWVELFLTHSTSFPKKRKSCPRVPSDSFSNRVHRSYSHFCILAFQPHLPRRQVTPEVIRASELMCDQRPETIQLGQPPCSFIGAL